MIRLISRFGDALHLLVNWHNPTFRRAIVILWVFLIETAFMSYNYFNFLSIAGMAITIAGMMILFGIYIHRYRGRIYDTPRKILLLGLLWWAVVFTAVVTAPFMPPYLVPLPAISMVTVLLFDFEVGIIATMIYALSAGISTGTEISATAAQLLTGLFSCLMVRRVVQRNDITKIVPWISLVGGALAIAAGLLAKRADLTVLIDGAWGAAGGLISAIVAMGVLPFLESGFRMTTVVRLYELSNPNQKLLKDLMTNAPGTYNHSIVVGNLVEAAAEAIEANPILARVAAYYHDIGKMKRPFFFIENQLNFNEHDKINPSLSRLIITAHVKEGVELAKENNLPDEIVEIIEQHHGTTIVSYFYQRAQEQIAKAKVTADDYRYQGIKPRSAEAALVMLADSVEAAARTMEKPSLKKLEQLVRLIVHEKLEDGQLDDSALTMAHLEKISKAFVQVLSGVYHFRIEYPKQDIRELKKRTVIHGDFGRQPAK